jgi:pimeloyl-ACP methyl ester carboxylesterase
MILWRNWSTLAAMLSAVSLVACSAGVAQAQDAKTGASARPAAVEIAPKTRDKVQLAATFYPAPTKSPDGKPLPGKDVVPVILLHGHKGSRADMHALALKLQDAGHAAIAIDLRGHGGSTKQALPNGKERTIDPDRMTKNDVMNMVNYDVESGKQYLMDRNNAGELNIDKLCVVGADLGAVVAANWAMLDWSWPRLATGKQGQDVKAVVLLSPPKNVRGMAIMPALTKREIASKLSWLVVYGEQESDAKDAKTAAGQLEKWLPMPSADEAKEKQALYVLPLPTNLQGTKLLSAENFNVAAKLMNFIDLRLVKKSYPWADRKTIP